MMVYKRNQRFWIAKTLNIIKKFLLFLLVAGSLLIGDSLFFYSKGYCGQMLLKIAWHKSKLSGINTKPWSWSKTYLVGRLIIPDITFDKIIIEGTNDGSLLFGFGHITGTALPNQIGNCVISGHRDSFFSDLNKLSESDIIMMKSKSYCYTIKSIHIVNPMKYTG